MFDSIFMSRSSKRILHNRLKAVMLHISRYSFKPQARLAQDAKISTSAISRIVNCRTKPSLEIALAITQVIEKALNRKLDPRELFSFDGTYPTASACELCSCHGCNSDFMFDENEEVKPEFKHLKTGEWSVTLPEKKAVNSELMNNKKK